MHIKFACQSLSFCEVYFTIEVFVVKTAIVYFFKIEIKYDSKGKFHTENKGNIGFLWK